MKNEYYITLIISILISTLTFAQNHPKDLVFQIEVTTGNNSITLNWNTHSFVSSYQIMRKKPSDATFVALTNNQYSQNTYTDNTVIPGQKYEYAIYAGHTNNVSGYVLAGINIAEQHHRGNIMLMIDSTYMVPASEEIDLFKRDLIKEGWKVLIDYAGRGESPTTVKQRILNCNSTTNLEGIILMGHVPVPYSGNIAPDAHPDHIGAWPSDIYYGDMCSVQNSIWGDALLVNTTASSARNHNIIGDGKFDVSSLGYTNTQKIFVGRIDVFNMPLINSDDVALFKQYINKNHNYRACIKKFRYQGLVDDNFGWVSGEAFAQNGWRNLSSLLSPDSVHAGKLIADTKNDSYLWSYACGPGWYQGATGVGYITNFNSNQMETVFTMIYGSYFGDWDNANNFLRGPIASPSSSLVSIWAGRPNWFLHTMSLGDPIGYSMLNSIDNTGTYFPKGFANAQVHQSIQGDPSLRMYVYEAPTNLEAFAINNGASVKLEWSASLDPNVVGYYVYRASNIDGDFFVLNQTPITSLTFTDNSPITSSTNDVAYMVRAVKVQQTPTGNFNNLSPGAITEGMSSNAPLPVSIISFSGKKELNNTNVLNWEVAQQKNILRYEIQRGYATNGFETIGEQEVSSDMNTSYSFIDYSPQGINYYRLKIVDENNHVSYHSKIVFISNNSSNAEVLLFPNPASDNIYLDIKEDYDKQGIQLSVFDMTGRIVYNTSKEINNTLVQIPTGNLARGNYILRYKKDDESIAQNIKFSKE